MKEAILNEIGVLYHAYSPVAWMFLGWLIGLVPDYYFGNTKHKSFMGFLKYAWLRKKEEQKAEAKKPNGFIDFTLLQASIAVAMALIIGFGAGIIQGRKAVKPATASVASEHSDSHASSSDTTSKSNIGSLKAKKLLIKPNGDIVAKDADISGLASEMKKLASESASNADKKSVSVEVAKVKPLDIFALANFDKDFVNLGYSVGVHYDYYIAAVNSDKDLTYQGFSLGFDLPIQ